MLMTGHPTRGGTKAAVALRPPEEPEQLIFLDWIETLGRWIGGLLIFIARLGLLGLLMLFLMALWREYAWTEHGDGFPWVLYLMWWLGTAAWLLPWLRARRREQERIRFWRGRA